MNDEILSLLRSISKNHPLGQIVESVLLPELKFSAKIEVLEPITDAKKFEGIYRRRHQHLTSKKISNYGILESIPCVKTYQGELQCASIDTKNYQGYIWFDLGFQNLIALVLVAREASKNDEAKHGVRLPIL